METRTEKLPLPVELTPWIQFKLPFEARFDPDGAQRWVRSRGSLAEFPQEPLRAYRQIAVTIDAGGLVRAPSAAYVQKILPQMSRST
jgi:hypothetical protein